MEQVITETQDLTYLSWARARQSSGTAGTFLKSYDDVGDHKVYYKLSDYSVADGIIGHECVNELVVSRLLTVLGVEHVRYRLIHARVSVDGRELETWLSASDDFKASGESKIALDTLYELERAGGESPLEFCLHQGWGERIWEMLSVDYLILNRDRHGANIEVLRNSRTQSMWLAPLFDHGLSLAFRCRSPQEIEAFDVMADLPVQCFVGSSSAWENLSLIPEGEFPALNPLREEDRVTLLEGLEEAASAELRELIWEMIWRRWCALEALRAA